MEGLILSVRAYDYLRLLSPQLPAGVTLHAAENAAEANPWLKESVVVLADPPLVRPMPG